MTETAPHSAPAPATGSHTPLRPVFLGLRFSLHVLVSALVAFVIVRAILLGLPHTSWVVAVALVLLATYISGAFLTRGGASTAAQLGWLALVTVEGLALIALTPDAGFLVFPLFFLQLHLLPPRWGIAAVLLSTMLTIIALALHNGWTIGGVLGPIIGAIVAVVIGLGYRALYREAEERRKLIDDLIRTRQELAARERESGVLEERARLAREIHDTVAQGLSSIQLLLHAAEREEGEVALTHLRLARETASVNLAEARRFVRELTPPALAEQSLPSALQRLAETASGEQLQVSFQVSGTVAPLPMRLETALLRIAQASLANVVQHSGARRAELTLTYLDDWVGVDIVDDGIGFDPAESPSASSFGLAGLRDRVAQLGGRLSIESTEGGGTAIAVAFDLPEVTP